MTIDVSEVFFSPSLFIEAAILESHYDYIPLIIMHHPLSHCFPMISLYIS